MVIDSTLIIQQSPLDKDISLIPQNCHAINPTLSSFFLRSNNGYYVYAPLLLYFRSTKLDENSTSTNRDSKKEAKFEKH